LVHVSGFSSFQQDGPLPDLVNKAALVTGASSGIGAALAKAFSRAGARVTLVARRLNLLRRVADSCPGETQVIAADLTDDPSRRSIVEQAVARWGRLDVLVNSAGMGAYGDFLHSTDADWRRLFEINLFSPVFLTQYVLPIMQRQGSGIIVNIASIGGLVSHSDRVTAYVASKHALVGFSRGLAKDLAGSAIRVLAVCPHLTDTEFFSTSSGADKMAATIEKCKVFMDSPEEVAKGVMDQIDSDDLVIFPTDKPARAYRKQRDI
jgi:uncharacterized protein